MENPTIEEATVAFWAKTDKRGPNDCWLWRGKKDRGGYGRFPHPTKSGKRGKTAHRFSFELHYHEIAPGAYICHHCDTPACVNPSHIYQGDAQTNCDDAIERGRRRPFPLPAG